jgi:anaerobic magnesium-protoporphyrin IX monomethyl ester cyclase
MKALFIFETDFSTIPLSILTLSSVLKKNGHECEFIDLRFEFNYLKKIKDIKPDVVGYTAVSFTWKYYQQINLEIKKRYSVFSIFGGAHCTVNPDVINDEGVDAICIGEGEFAMLELMDKMDREEDITQIGNLWIKIDGQIYKNPIRNLVDDLDVIPFSDYELISEYYYYRKMGIYYFMTSRGCPFNCPYCINHFYKKLYTGKGRYLRRRSVDNVIEELLIIKNRYHAKLIIFNDDVFTCDKKWLEEFAPKYFELIGLPFEAYTRVDSITEDQVKLLASMGCIALYFGIESGNKDIRYLVLKRKIEDHQITNTAALCQKYHIKTMSFNIVCLPGETLENAFETLLINAKCKITYPMCFVFQPFPNIELTQYAVDQNFFDGSTEVFYRNLTLGKSLLKSKDIRQMERLHFLFIIGVKMPFTIPLIRVLIRLPLRLFYHFLLFASKSFIVIFLMYRPSLKYYLLYHLGLPFRKIKKYITKHLPLFFY